MRLPYSNLQIQHWNPGATVPLVLPIQNYCNTDEERLHEHIRVNSRLPGRRWLTSEEPHGQKAILCGSGPSIADDMDQIEQRYEDGAAVFALNGAARYLSEQGILPDYQVILDAREDSAELIGPAHEHLFASQCHPETFRRCPSATLWHLAYEHVEEDFAELGSPGPYALIGSGVSVGISALCVAYTLGHREIHCYGYDSCHRGDHSHAFRQPMNDGEPCAWVKFNGKDYLASFTMKMQAEEFQKTANALQALGCKVEVHGSGLLPDMWRAPPLPEAEKYRQMWAEPAYRLYSPGEELAADFVWICDVQPRHHVADLGCGTGRGGLEILQRVGCTVALVDFAANCLDPVVRENLGPRLDFTVADLAEEIPVRANYGFCVDVLEHIPPSQVDTVIRNCLAAAPICFFQVSTVDDACGQLIGQKLHLSVHSADWWRQRFETLGYTVQMVELGNGTAKFLVAQQ